MCVHTFLFSGHWVWRKMFKISTRYYGKLFNPQSKTGSFSCHEKDRRDSIAWRTNGNYPCFYIILFDHKRRCHCHSQSAPLVINVRSSLMIQEFVTSLMTRRWDWCRSFMSESFKIRTNLWLNSLLDHQESRQAIMSSFEISQHEIDALQLWLKRSLSENWKDIRV